MARSRNIKPSFFTNDTLADCSLAARMAFIGLWTVADREGRLEDRPKKIKAEILPYDDFDCDKLLWELSQRGFIIRYKDGNNNYIQVVNFNKHQNPHMKENASTIPAPDLSSARTELAPNDPGLNPLTDSLNPLTLTPIRKPVEKRVAGVIRPEGVSETTWEDFVKHRKAKRSPLTQTALKAIDREAALAGWTLDAALAETCSRGWQSFKAEWVTQQTKGKKNGKSIGEQARDLMDSFGQDEPIEGTFSHL